MLYDAWRKRRYWPDSPACYGLRPIIERIATMPVTSRYLRLTLYTVLILVGAVVAGGWAMQQAKHHALEESARRGPEQLSLYANSLHTLIERYRALPAVLALDPELIARLGRARHPRGTGPAQPQTGTHQRGRAVVDAGAARQHRTGRGRQQLEHLQQLCGPQLRVSPLFQPDPQPGHRALLCGGRDQRDPGLFLSSAVHDGGGRFLGAIVVKLEFPELEREWSQGSDTLLVSDARGIVFIANQPGWRYRHLRPLNDSDRDEHHGDPPIRQTAVDPDADPHPARV
jgi:two-component system, NtrC family, C4-dicarboxylate transport sensor histidine kinase DctB